ncbi:unnamed protein product, partial [Timema podura]|nr:unnamed protein product [Timema podura]
VPVLDTGDKVLTESLEIVLFLDKNYPGTTLRNTDPEKSAKDREIVEKFEGTCPVASAIYGFRDPSVLLIKEFHEGIKNKDYQSPETLAILSLFQSELEKRGTTFLAGDSPGLADFIIWPLFERLKVTRELHGKGEIGNWKNGMLQQKAVKETMHTLEEHFHLYRPIEEYPLSATF